jgi:PEGA domain
MVRLSHQGGTVTVASTPAGATIAIDGRDTGKVTPASVSVASGQHALGLKAEGYLQYESTITVAEGQSQSTSATLVPLGRVTEIKIKRGGLFGRRGGDKDVGTVSLRTSPPGAVVMVNGQMAPKATPVEFTLNPGGYELEFQLRGYKTVKKNIVVDAGAKNDVQVTLEQQ